MDILLAHVAKPKTMAAEPILMLLGAPWPCRCESLRGGQGDWGGGLGFRARVSGLGFGFFPVSLRNCTPAFSRPYPHPKTLEVPNTPRNPKPQHPKQQMLKPLQPVEGASLTATRNPQKG